MLESRIRWSRRTADLQQFDHFIGLGVDQFGQSANQLTSACSASAAALASETMTTTGAMAKAPVDSLRWWVYDTHDNFPLSRGALAGHIRGFFVDTLNSVFGVERLLGAGGVAFARGRRADRHNRSSLRLRQSAEKSRDGRLGSEPRFATPNRFKKNAAASAVGQAALKPAKNG